MIINASNTIYNILLQSAMLSGKKYYPLPNTTLNEKWNIYPGYKFDNYQYPTLNLITIGVGDPIDTNNNLLNFKKSIHSPIDGALYNHAPFYIVPVDATLNKVETALYRLRVLKEINGKSYYCYYGLTISDILYQNQINLMKLSDIATGVVKYDTFTDSSILNPQPGRLIDIREITDQAVINIMKILVKLSSTVLSNLDNAIRMLYNIEDYTINEIGVCSGIDVPITDTYTESMWTQINYFISSDLSRKAVYKIIKDNNLYIDVGGMLPLLYGK